jgi:hypothetical protein
MRMSWIWRVQKARGISLTQDDTDELTRLSQIAILDGEEWSLSEAIDGYEEQSKTVQKPSATDER